MPVSTKSESECLTPPAGLKFDEAKCLFSTCLSLQGDHHCTCAQKWCHFSCFPKSFQTNNNNNNELWPKMTKIASRGSCLQISLPRELARSSAILACWSAPGACLTGTTSSFDMSIKPSDSGIDWSSLPSATKLKVGERTRWKNQHKTLQCQSLSESQPGTFASSAITLRHYMQAWIFLDHLEKSKLVS